MTEVNAKKVGASSPENPPQIAVTNLRSSAEAVIRGWIIAGRLEPRQLYTIRGVAEGLGVSVTPVREAIVHLASRGIVEVIRNRGFQVVEFDDDALDELLYMRLLLEVGTLERVAGTLSAERIAHYRSLVAEMFEMAPNQDHVADYLDTARKFHVGLVSELGMPRLTEHIGDMRDRARIFAVDEPQRLIEGNKEHEAILEAIIVGDRQRVHALMVRHLLHHRGSWVNRNETSELMRSFDVLDEI